MLTARLALANLRRTPSRTVITLIGITLSSALLSVICCFASVMISDLEESSSTYTSDKMVFMMLVLAVACTAVLLIRSLFAISFNERVNILGLFSTVGMTNSDKLKMIGTETALYGLIGGAAGTVIGRFLSKLHIDYMNRGMVEYYLSRYNIDYSGEPFYKYDVPASVLFASFLLAVAVTLLAALKPMIRLSRLSVINSLKADVRINVSLQDGIFEIIMCKFFGRIGRLAGQNFDNNAPRYRAVSFTLPCAQIVFVSIYALFMWGFWEEGIFYAYDDPRFTSGISIGFILTLLALLGAMGSMTVNINGRKREFAALKSMGMSNRDMLKLMLCESIFIFLHAVVFGLVGSFLSVMAQYLFLWTSNTVQWFHFPWREWFVFVGIDALFCVIFAFYAVLKVRKINVASAMK